MRIVFLSLPSLRVALIFRSRNRLHSKTLRAATPVLEARCLQEQSRTIIPNYKTAGT